MTAPLEPALAAAYVHELSAAVRAVAVVGASGELLTGPPALAALATQLEHGVVSTSDGVVWVAKGPDRTVIAVAGPTGQTGSTALDIAAAAGADLPVEAMENPSAELKTFVQDVIAKT